MKKILFFFAAILSCCMFFACGSEEAEEVLPAKISVSEVTFTKDGGTQRISISNATNITLPEAGDWYKFAIVNNMNGMTYVNVTASPNESYEARKTTVTFVADKTNLSLTLSQEATPEPEPEPEPTAAFKMGQEMGLGWNLGNNMDAVDNWTDKDHVVAIETAWGNPEATKATFDKLAQYGIKVVRIPVTWQGHVGEAPDYSIDEKWMGRVTELVNWALDAKLKVVINIHHDEGAGEGHYGFLDIRKAAYDATLNASIKEQLKAMWTQIATNFKNTNDNLIFEGMNEVQDGGWGWTQGANGNLGDGGKQYATLNEWQQVFVDAVRAVGGQNTNRWLAVVGYAQNPNLTMQQLKLPTDPTANRLMVAVHCYDPYDFCTAGKYNEWGHTSKESGTRNGEAEISALMDKLKATYVDKDIPVFFGEMGAVNRESERARKFQQYYMQYFARCAYEHGLGCMIWDNGVKGKYGEECFGFIDHGTGEYIGYAQSIIESMVKALTDPDCTLESIYATAP